MGQYKCFKTYFRKEGWSDCYLLIGFQNGLSSDKNSYKIIAKYLIVSEKEKQTYHTFNEI